MKLYYTLICCLLTVSALAQEYVITLKPAEDTVIQNRNFYFDAVEDNREQDQGKRLVGRFGRNDKTAAMLGSDLEEFFLTYLTTAYPKRDGDRAVTLRINNIQCTSTGGMLSEARVKLDLDIINSSTEAMITNLALEKTRQPLMEGKTFGVLIQEILSAGVEMVKIE